MSLLNYSVIYNKKSDAELGVIPGNWLDGCSEVKDRVKHKSNHRFGIVQAFCKKYFCIIRTFQG